MSVTDGTAGYDAYAEFRTALSDPNMPTGVALVARKYAADRLDDAATEAEQSLAAKVPALLSGAVADAKALDAAQLSRIVAEILVAEARGPVQA